VPRITPDPKLRALHKAIGEDSLRARLNWLRHPAVREAVERARAEAEACVDPVSRVWHSQYAITLFTVKALGFNAWGPDGIAWPDPLSLSPPERVPWPTSLPLTKKERIAWQLRVQPQFAALLSRLSYNLAQLGVPLDPSDPGDKLVLSQLLFLNVPWAEPDRLANNLNMVGLGGWTLDEEQRFPRSRLASAKAEQRLLALNRLHRARVGRSHIPAPYARGEKRATKSSTIGLRRALSELAATKPEMTPDRLLSHFDNHPDNCVGCAVEKIVKEFGKFPDRSTLQRNWPAIRPK
jgi:hypothetical protein